MGHNKCLYQDAPKNLGSVLYRQAFYQKPVPTTVPRTYCGTPCPVKAGDYVYIRLFHTPIVCTAACLEQHGHHPVERSVVIAWEE